MTRRRVIIAALVVAVAIAVVASGVLGKLPNFEEVITQVATTLGRWTYLLVGGMTFLETGAFVGLIAPGETVVLVGGVIAAQGTIDVVTLIGIVWAAAVLGDSTSFWIGRRLGRAFMLEHGPRFKITPERLANVEGYFHRHGGKTILIGRFIGLVRAIAPFIAGSSGLPYRRFLPYSVIGAGLWGTTFTLLGYIFYRSFSRVAHIAGQATLAFGIVVAVTLGLVYAYRRRARIVAWLEQRPALRPLVPRLRFVWRRLTPGELGIEFTTMIAVAIAGLYVFAAYAVVLHGGTALTPGDRMAADVVAKLRTDTLVDIAKIVTDVGSSAVVGPLVLVAAGLLLWRRRPAEALVLVVGFALLVLAVQEAKAGIHRSRPEGGFTGFRGKSYPSGHTAYATTYVALAVAVARALPGLVSRAALVTAALVVAVVVGLTRIYLGVHYWSDVAGGWSLGFGVYAACGAIALVVAHIRHNERAPVPSDHG